MIVCQLSSSRAERTLDPNCICLNYFFFVYWATRPKLWLQMLFRVRAAKALLGSKVPFWKLGCCFPKKSISWAGFRNRKKFSTPWKIPSKPLADLWNLGWLIQKDRRMWRAPICIIYQLCLFWTKTQKRHFYKVFEPHKRTTGSLKAFGSIAKKKCSTSQTSPIRFFTFQLIQSIRTFSQRRPRQRQRKSKGSPISPPFCFNLISELVIRCCFKMPLENLVFVHDINFLLFPYSFSYLLKSHWTLQAFLTCLDKISSSCLSCDRYSGTFYFKLKYFFSFFGF